MELLVIYAAKVNIVLTNLVRSRTVHLVLIVHHTVFNQLTNVFNVLTGTIVQEKVIYSLPVSVYLGFTVYKEKILKTLRKEHVKKDFSVQLAQ